MVSEEWQPKPTLSFHKHPLMQKHVHPIICIHIPAPPKESWYILNVITKMLVQEHNMSETNNLIVIPFKPMDRSSTSPSSS